jgi:hypothetical protein
MGATTSRINERHAIRAAKIRAPESPVPVVAYVIATKATIRPAMRLRLNE